MQAEARFREELGSVNITVESRMFRTEDDPVETADLYVSSTADNDFILGVMFNKLTSSFIRLKAKTIECLC